MINSDRPAIIVGGIWALASVYMLFSRVKEPPTITRWSISGRYFRKVWSGVKTGFSYVVLAVIIATVYEKFPDNYGSKSIYQQVIDGSLEPLEIESLLSRGADIDYKDKDSNTALSMVLSWSEDELAVALIEAGADLSIEIDEYLPLEYAVYNDSNMDVIETMLKKGALLDVDTGGSTLLDYSKEYENSELEKLLVQYSRKSQ